MALACALQKLPKATIARQVTEVAKTLRIENLLTRTPRQLSGGQRQRVAIGRSIIRNPKVFLFDEPLSNLDAALRVQMRLELERLHQRLGATMIYVTHDQTEAMTLANRIAVFNAGRIEQIGTPMELYSQPANAFVAGFIGAPAMNFIPAILAMDTPKPALSFGTCRINLNSNLANNVQAGPVSFGIRPEHLEICSNPDADFIAEVEIVEQLGSEQLVYLHVDFCSESITVKTQGTNTIAQGDAIAVRANRDHLHIFDQQGQSITKMYE